MQESTLKTIIIIIVLMLLGRGCGYVAGYFIQKDVLEARSASDDRNSSDSSIDLEIERKVIKEETEDGFNIYYVIFYGKDTRSVKDFYLEFLYDKEEGIRLEDIDQDYIRNIFPSFSELSVEESDRYVNVTIKMKDIEDNDRIQELADKNFIVVTDDEPSVVDADYLYNSFLEDGFTDAPVSDYEFLDLSR